jgi:hypothetical protein
MAGPYVEGHTPALGAVDPADVGAVAEVHTAAVQAAATLRDHYHQQVLGQGSQAGDPMPWPSTLQPVPPNSQPDMDRPGVVGQP